MHTHLARLSLVFVALAAACGDETAGPSFEEVSWSEAEVLISSESAALAAPVDIAVGLDGTVFVLDAQDARIQPVDPEGGLLNPIGVKGSGPGEFDSPSALCVTGDTLWVIDAGNGRMQTLTTTGDLIGTTPLPPRAAASISRVGPGGKLLVATLGRDSALASLYDRGGDELARFGAPIAEVPQIIRIAEIHREIAEGQIPDFFRNTVQPAFAQEDDVWLGLPADGIVQRYALDGSLRMESQLTEPEFEKILSDFVRKNGEPTERPSLFPLMYFADLRMVGSELWILLNLDDEDSGVIVVLSEDGARVRRILLPTVRGAKVFAVDPLQNRLYLAVPSAAELVAVSMGEW